jgi:predicted Zn-dependent protease
MLYARALAAHGALRVPDPSSDKGLRHRYDLAADVLVAVRDLPSQRSPSSPAAQLLYDVYVRYGDLLASTDRPAMALLSYQRAVEIGTHDPQRALQIGPNDPRRADLHGIWLQQRLQAEEAKANKRLAEAMKDKPDDIGNALLELYVSFCRQAKWADADEVFAKLEAAVGGVPPELRLQRAVHRFAALEDAKNQASAETELRRVIREKPDLHRAKYELARVLEWQGTLERFTEARDLYEAAARDGVREDWALEADARAQVMAEVIRTTPR